MRRRTRIARVQPAAFLLGPAIALAVIMAGAPVRGQAATPFVESAAPAESVPSYMRQLAGRDLDDLLLGDGVAAQSGWLAHKYGFYLAYHGTERTPDWLTLGLANTPEREPPLNLAEVVALLLPVGDRAHFLRDYQDRLAAAGPWRLCLSAGGAQVLIHNRGTATFISFGRRTLSADIDCIALGE